MLALKPTGAKTQQCPQGNWRTSFSWAAVVHRPTRPKGSWCKACWGPGLQMQRPNDDNQATEAQARRRPQIQSFMAWASKTQLGEAKHSWVKLRAGAQAHWARGLLVPRSTGLKKEKMVQSLCLS
eukprot:1141136-Pelagomonas_calceolata.AAC.5